MNDVEETLRARGSRYGTIEANAELTQRLLEIVSESEQWEHLSRTHKEVVHMIFHKLSRMITGDPWYDDNTHDIAGYATLLTNHILEHNDDPHST